MTESTWTIDNAHSGVHFSVRHMMITNVRGEFGTVSGTVRWDPLSPEHAVIEADVDAASISTREAQRDAHLKGPDFLDVVNYPTISFRSKSVKPLSKGRLSVTGDLTIHGTTRPVTLDVKAPSSPKMDPLGNVRVGATATTKIRRVDFGMTWNSVVEAGGVLVGDEISVTLDVSLIRRS